MVQIKRREGRLGVDFGDMTQGLFQSTRPRGARRRLRDKCTPELKFQSTRPRGARQNADALGCRDHGFNPRALAGRDFAPI